MTGLHLRDVDSGSIEITADAIVSYATTIMGKAYVTNDVQVVAVAEIVGMLTGLQMLDLPRHCVRRDGIRLVIEFGKLVYAGRRQGFIPFRPVNQGEFQT